MGGWDLEMMGIRNWEQGFGVNGFEALLTGVGGGTPRLGGGVKAVKLGFGITTG